MNLLAAITESTCGEACWQAREDICRCSCGGKNHGCLRGENGTRPTRICKIQGEMHELVAVGYDLDKQTQAINEAHGITFPYPHTARDFMAGPAKMRPASDSQVERWEELTAFRDVCPAEKWWNDNPGKCMVEWPGRPYLLWVRLMPAKKAA